jgi:ABC transporter substrate binding protein
MRNRRSPLVNSTRPRICAAARSAHAGVRHSLFQAGLLDTTRRPEKDAAFLEALRNGAPISLAAKAAAYRRTSIYQERPDTAVYFLPDITIQAMAQQAVALVQRHRLPTIYSDLIYVKLGGLAFYGADRGEIFRRAAGYVDRNLRGEKPGELPFQQPTKYQFVLNLKTAYIGHETEYSGPGRNRPPHAGTLQPVCGRVLARDTRSRRQPEHRGTIAMHSE